MREGLANVAIVILNWQGGDLLADLLVSLKDALETYGRAVDAIVLDNNPDDRDHATIARFAPDVRLVVAPTNDYLYSYNWLMPQLSASTVILLNNDLRVDRGFIAPLLAPFEDDVFAVGAASFDLRGDHRISGAAKLHLQRGWTWVDYDLNWNGVVPTLFASGGFMAVNRQKYLELGGFDRLFYPAYGEDLDLGFRAWCRGWRSLFQPASMVFHQESSSWKAVGEERRADLVRQMVLLFAWRDLGLRRYAGWHGLQVARRRFASRRGDFAGWRDSIRQAEARWRAYTETGAALASSAAVSVLQKAGLLVAAEPWRLSRKAPETST